MIGIYKITNLSNGKVYIGQSWDIENRFIKHKYERPNQHLENAIKKYRYQNFRYEIIKELINTCQDELNELEIFYINKYNSTDKNFGYNKTYGGSSGKATEETRRKLSLAQKGKIISEEHRACVSRSNKTRIVTEETRKKMSDNRKGEKCYWYGRNVSGETKRKLSLINSKKTRCIETGIVYESAALAAKIHGNKSSCSIIRACKNKNKTACNGFHWEYVIDTSRTT
jgi:group I intron endonuclease